MADEQSQTALALLIVAIIFLSGCNDNFSSQIHRGERYAVVDLRITECLILQKGVVPPSLSEEEYFSDPEDQREDAAEVKLLKEKCKPVNHD